MIGIDTSPDKKATSLLSALRDYSLAHAHIHRGEYLQAKHLLNAVLEVRPEWSWCELTLAKLNLGGGAGSVLDATDHVPGFVIDIALDTLAPTLSAGGAEVAEANLLDLLARCVTEDHAGAQDVHAASRPQIIRILAHLASVSEMFLSQGDYGRAVAIVRTIIDRHPTPVPPDMLIQVARTLTMCGVSRPAAALFEQAADKIGIPAMEPDALAWWCCALLGAGDLDGFERVGGHPFCRGALQDIAHSHAAIAMMVRGHPGEAITQLAALNQLPPAYTPVNLGLMALAYMMMGDLSEARRVMSESLSLDPANVFALVARALIAVQTGGTASLSSLKAEATATMASVLPCVLAFCRIFAIPGMDGLVGLDDLPGGGF